MFHPFSHIHLRSPLQSLREAYALSTDSKIIFQEGLYLSSPDFWKELQKRAQLNEKEGKKMDLSYAKYWLRSSARCTPYGTFAGSAMIPVTEEDSVLELQESSRHRRSLRLDMNYLAEIVQALVQMPVIREQIKFFSNNSIYQTSDGYRYAEYSTGDNTRVYHLTFIEKAPYITAILKRAAMGATLQELSQLLMQTENVTEQEAAGFVTDLWQAQLLTAGLEPAVTGADPFDQLLTHLEHISGLGDMLPKFKEIQQLLHHPEEGVGFYMRVEEKLRNLGLSVMVPKNTLQTDLFLATHEGHISRELVAAIVRQAGELKALSRRGKNEDLQDFARKFHARYEEAEIPLSIALDADLGIGYAGSRDESAGGGALVDGLPVIMNRAPGNGPSFDYIQQYTLGKYNEWAVLGKDGIEILEEELKLFEKNSDGFKFPDCMYLIGSLFKQEGQMDARHFVFDLAGMGGPSGANLLSRFTQGDAALCQYVRELVKAEEQVHPEIMYAEIAHLPQARVGNILLRPVLRDYEIPYVGLSGAEADHQIPLDDLVVSVRSNEVFLRSRKHNKRVIPRLTTAHNFGVMSLPVYKFLCDLQGQGLAFPNVWDWGHLVFLKHLPRVVYKKLIIHKASWKMEEGDLTGMPGAFEAWPAYFQTFRARFKLPERVVYQEGDNELLIDFTQDKGIELFVHYLKRHKTIKLEEFLFTEDNCVVTDITGAPYTNELVIPVGREIQDKPLIGGSTGKAGDTPGLIAGKDDIQRVFLPYSEWLYFKIYSGAKTAEHLLASVILSFMEEGIKDRLFERSFFIRYQDESGGHIRIRVFNRAMDKQLIVYRKMMELLQPLMDNGTLDRVMLDTYKREVERYTPEFIDASERIFHNDSLAVLRFIHLLEGIEGEQYRFLFAMRGIDALLNDFGLSPEQKAALLKELQAGFFKEFGGHPSLQKQLNERYRKNQRFLSDHMDERRDVENEIDEAAALFSIRSEMNRPIIREIFSGLAASGKTEKIPALLSSFIHMFINRLFIAQQRKYELVVYHFLEKYYASRMAITKKEKQHVLSTI